MKQRKRTVKKNKSKQAEPDFASLDTLPDLLLMGVSVFDPAWSQNWHQDQRVELLYVMQGHMTLVQPNRRFRLGPGELALVSSGQRHRDEFNPADEPDIFMVRFFWKGATAFFRDVSNEQIAALSDHARNEARQIVLRLQELPVTSSPIDHLMSRALLHVLLLQLWVAVRGSPEETVSARDRRHELMIRARRYMDVHYAQLLSLDQMAKHLNVSPFYLSHVFSRESGFSVMSYLTSIRMEHAHKMLRSRKGNVSEVAFTVGYESSAYFSRVFKRHFGVAPTKVALEAAPRRQ